MKGKLRKREKAEDRLLETKEIEHYERAMKAEKEREKLEIALSKR